MEPQTMIEKEPNMQLSITELSPMGYGNPDSTISYDKQRESGELRPLVDESAQEFIRSKEGMVPVREKDDGCIDGRPTESLYLTENGELTTKTANSENHERAKVAGGGYITSQAMLLGIGVRVENVDKDLADLGAKLAEKGVYCGAHTGSHKHGDGTDCGANDKEGLILENGLKFKEEIKATAKALIETAGLTFNETTFESVIENWSNALKDENYFKDSTGQSRLNAILATQEAVKESEGSERPLAVTKHLSGDHNEDYIVINFVEGTTFSQTAFANNLQEEFPDYDYKHLAQAFVVDAWRVVELAQAVAPEESFEAALYAGVMYQVSTAATLTDGSLKIFAVTKIGK